MVERDNHKTLNEGKSQLDTKDVLSAKVIFGSSLENVKRLLRNAIYDATVLVRMEIGNNLDDYGPTYKLSLCIVITLFIRY